MSDQSERDILVRTETQLQEQIRNLTNIRTDLNNIYDKIDKEARSSTIVGSELKFLKESTLQKISDIDKKIVSLEEAVGLIKKDISEETKDREIFQEGILSSFRTTRVIVLILTGVLGVIATIFGILAYFKG